MSISNAVPRTTSLSTQERTQREQDASRIQIIGNRNALKPTELTEPRPANRVLAGLTFDIWQRISPQLGRCLLFPGQVLHESDEPASRLYFPNSGLISLVQTVDIAQPAASHQDRCELVVSQRIEVAAMGKETFTGALCLLSEDESLPLQVVVQTPGTAFYLPTSVLRDEFERDIKVRQLVFRHANWLMQQMARTALCASSHVVEARLSRWLLQAREHLAKDEIPVTHAAISQMLGVRRSGVTMTLLSLQQRGLLRTARGRVIIEDAAGLDQVACSCRAALQPTFEQLTVGTSTNAFDAN